MRVLIVIPARGGSTRVPRKNLEEVGGMTLLERAIDCVDDIPKLLENSVCGIREALIVVSTDDHEMAAEAQCCLRAKGSHIHMRPASLGKDGPMVDVLVDALDDAVTRLPDYALITHVACIQPTSPLRVQRDVVACLRMAAMAHSSVVSVDESTGKRNGAVYVTRVDMLREGKVFDDRMSGQYPMPHERSLDINEPSDLEEARRILG